MPLKEKLSVTHSNIQKDYYQHYLERWGGGGFIPDVSALAHSHPESY